MKLIFVTGWVLSGIGKWISGASLGALLESCGYKITMQKFDGYLNVDASMINPLKHGESFITSDGAETDLDIGHYERFINTDMKRESSYTMGKLYQEIIQKERSWQYQGNDVQIVPHMTDLIKSKIIDYYNTSGADIAIIEIGGTVGDIENEVLVEAARQMWAEHGQENICFLHIVYLPYLASSQELKTKPAQNSVRDLRARGIVANILLLRADYEMNDALRQKFVSMTGIAYQATIPVPTLDSIYQMPEYLNSYKLSEYILQQFKLPAKNPQLKAWNTLTTAISQSENILKIALIGEYKGEGDVYYSLIESLKIAWRHQNHQVSLTILPFSSLDSNIISQLDQYDGLCASCDEQSSLLQEVVEFAKEKKIPYLGIEGGAYALIQPDYADLWGRRPQQGDGECLITWAATHAHLYPENSTSVSERYRYKSLIDLENAHILEKSNLSVLASNPSLTTIDAREFSDHPFMVGVVFHPELTTRPTQPHALFNWFIASSIHYSNRIS